jgi:hypothetical protein
MSRLFSATGAAGGAPVARPSRLSRRSFLASLAAVPTLAGLLAACGDDSSPDGSGTNPDSTGTGDTGTNDTTTVPSSGLIEHGTGADDVVVRIDSAVGGFTTQEFAFQQIPALLVTGDGRAFRPGVQIEIYPPPLLPAVEVLAIDEAMIQSILAAADESGLLAAPPDYEEGQPNVTDVGSTVVTIAAGGQTYVHSAYALGMDAGTETTPARAGLQRFVDAAQQMVATSTGGEIFAPAEYEIWAQPDDVANYSDEPMPTVQPWPAETGVALADASNCLAVPADAVQAIFEQANQLSFFEDAGITYRLIVRPVLPGADRCPT